MWFKIIILITLSSVMILYGVLWYIKSFSSNDRYDFKEDFRRSFLTPHWTYEAFFNDDKPRRIVPIIMILGGIVILIVGLIKII